MVVQKLKDYTQHEIPSHVAKELTLQITNYLSNHIQMTQIINFHIEQLNLRLTQTATETLNKLMNEPQFHLTTKAYLDAIQQKGDLKLLEVETYCNQQLTRNYEQFSNQLIQLKRTNDKELSDLKDGLIKLDNVEKQLSKYERNLYNNEKSISYLNQKVETLQILLGFTCAIFSGTLYYISTKY